MFGAAGTGTPVALAVLLTGVLVGSSALAQAPAPPANSGQETAPKAAGLGQAGAAQPAKTTPSPAAAKSAGTAFRYRPDRFAGRAGAYYKVIWGIDSLNVKWAESGEVIRFAWHVLDPEKAKVLNDKKAEPSLIDPAAGVSLVVPTMEKIGQLRQGALPEAGKSYWMIFSNKGLRVKRGDRVDVVIGAFRAEGLVVD
jgi:hypothetical protein